MKAIDAKNIVYSTENDSLIVYTGAATNNFVGFDLVKNATDLFTNEELAARGFDTSKTTDEKK